MAKLSSGEDTTALLTNGNVATIASRASLFLNQFVNAEALLSVYVAPYNAALNRKIHVKTFQIPGQQWSIVPMEKC